MAGVHLFRKYPILFTILAVLLATASKVILRDLIHVSAPMLLFYSAIVLSAWFGGFLQGLISIGLCLLSSYYFFAPANANLMELASFKLPPLIMFLVDTFFIAFLCAALRRSSLRAEKAASEVREALTNMQKSELRFRRVFESDMIGLIFSEPDGRVIQTNNYFLNLIGYSQEDADRGIINWRDLTPPEYQDMSLRTFRQLQTNGTFVPFEKEYIRRDGSRVPVMIGAAKLTDGCTVTFILDLSATQRAQKQAAEIREAADSLRQSQNFLNSVIDNIPNMVFVKDAQELRYIRINKAGKHLTGFTHQDLVGKSDLDFYPIEEAMFFQSMDRKTLEQRDVMEIKEETISTHHGLRYLTTKKIPIFDQNQKPLYLLGISEDITDRKIAEQQRQRLIVEQAARAEAEKAAEQLRFLSQASSALTENLDLKSMLQAFARVIVEERADWCEIVLINEEEMLLEEAIVYNKDPARVEKATSQLAKYKRDWIYDSVTGRVLRSGKPYVANKISLPDFLSGVNDSERRHTLQDWQPQSLISVPLCCYGRVMGSLTLYSSEERKRFSDLDTPLVQDLARRASFAIENSRLFKKAQEASRAKSSFLANMSHEIRTPLGAMLGFAELLADEQLNVDQRKYLSTLLRNGQQLMTIVDEILDLSKVESDSIQIEKIEFNPVQLIEDVMSLLRPQAEERNLLLHSNSLCHIPNKLVSDPTRLRQILLNVIGNAIKFTSTGSIDVHVELDEHDENSGILEISVSDSGIGIPYSQRDKLFQPFVQADSSTTRRFGGTGLGLFLSRRLARLLGGDVILGSSQPLKGSQFIITVEVKYGQQALKSLPAPTAHSVLNLEASSKILVVDDAADNRMLIQLYLSRLGLRADASANGYEAVDMALHRPYDLILMDVQMPEMDGFEAVHELRAQNYAGPIVALTAHTMKGDRERCLEGGFDDYLAKPLDRESLKVMLEKYVSRSEAYPPSPSTGASSDSLTHG